MPSFASIAHIEVRIYGLHSLAFPGEEKNSCSRPGANVVHRVASLFFYSTWLSGNVGQKQNMFRRLERLFYADNQYAKALTLDVQGKLNYLTLDFLTFNTKLALLSAALHEIERGSDDRSHNVDS